MACAASYDSDDSGSEEEEEPKLKYERICGDVEKILKKDGVSCVYVNPKMLLIGTRWGRIHVLDHQGNVIKMFSLHSGPVVMLDMDSKGDYFASCSHDKKVAVQGLYSNENCHHFAVDISVRCIAIDPKYSKLWTTRRFVIGTTQVVIYEKTLFGSLKATLISNEAKQGGTDLIRAMKWKENFLAWATDTAVRVMEMEKKNIISLIKRDHSLVMNCDQYPPHLCWQDGKTLLVGWGNSVKVCRVRERVPAKTSAVSPVPDLPPLYVEIVYMFTTDFYVCGIGPLDQLVVVLAYNKNFSKQEQESSSEGHRNSLSGLDWRRPQMRVLLPLQGSYEELSKDVLGIRCYQEYRPAHYHLESLVEERRFYIVCPQDIVVAKPREDHDRVQWLLEHERYEDALEVVNSCGGKVGSYSSLEVGRMYLSYLLNKQLYHEAAQLCPQILKSNKSLWQEVLLQFKAVHQLGILSPFIPIGSPGPVLDPPVYQTLLLDLLKTDHKDFLEVVQNWPGNLYNVSLIITNVLEELTSNANNEILLRALAHLYSNIEKYDKALAIYLKLRHTDVFRLIRQRCLFNCVAKHIMELMNLDAASALQICSEHIAAIHPSSVVNVLEKQEPLLYQYLDMLYNNHHDMCIPYHNQLVHLYARYERRKLLPLLHASSHFELEKALDTVKSYGYMQEAVHLLVRMGNSEEALYIVLEEEQDIEWAIRICKEHSDPDLWQCLIKHSLDKPAYIRELLNNVGTHIDPLMVIQCIPSGLEIPGLRDALVKIFHDYQLRVSLQTDYLHILVGDGLKLLKKEIAHKRAGLAVRADMDCALCNKNIIKSDGSQEEEESLVVFASHHACHSSCLGQDFPNLDV